ncbi:MAG: TlpA disulfide reductase family protein [Bacteroidota bacterium]
MLRAGLVALVLLSGCGPLTSAVAGQLPATGLGETAPALELADVRTGEAVDLAAFRGRAVMLNAWATWCGPCRAEMPALDSLQRERPDALAVVFVSDEAPELIRAYLADRPTEGIYAHAELADFVGPYAAVQGARPVTFVIDAEGILRERMIGAHTTDTFRQRLDALPR